VVNVGVAYLTRDTPAEGFEFITYREYVGVSSALLAFVAITAPDVICPDRRNRVLPLIFARPLDPAGYVVAKVGAIAALVFAFGFLPQVVLFVGQMLVSSGGALDYLRANAEVLWQVPAAVAVLALYYSSLGVALASLSSRRIVGGVAFVAVLLVSRRSPGRWAQPAAPAGSACPSPTRGRRSTCWPCRSTSATWSSSGTSTRSARWRRDGGRGHGAGRVGDGDRGRARRAALALPGGRMTVPLPPPPGAPPVPGPRAGP
jgi:hypothetical protein